MNKIINKITGGFALIAALFILFGTQGAHAGKLKVDQINQEVYNELQAKGTPTFIAFNATWCPHCRKQNKSLLKVKDNYEEEGKSVAIYSMDWDKREDYNIPAPNQRTTIVCILNNKIVDQLIGQTKQDKIKEFTDKNLSK